jgi:hypothetical protein
MSISSIGNSANLMGAAAQIAQGTTASDASMGVLKSAIDVSSAEASDLASIVASTGSVISVYA